jgi:predicted glycoside hydrolase/deacetylase ChbG (UPF0249 family)
MHRNLIITADDYGMCDAVNEGIEACLAAGAVRSTCVMVNMPACGAATFLRARFPQTSVGIHWNLTQGCSIVPASQISNLVSPDGTFHSAAELRRQWLMRKVRVTQIRAELIAQFHRFSDLAGKPDFWTTHENVHVLPGLFKTCVALGRELSIPAMRCHRRLIVLRETTSTHYYHLRHPLYWLKGRIIARWSDQAEAAGMLMPDGRIYTPGYAAGSYAVEDILTRLKWSQAKTAVEMVIHPATSVQRELFGSLTQSRVLEYQVWSDNGLSERLYKNGLETVGFEVLGTTS